MFFHHQTIKKYTAALLELFNDIEVQYLDSKNKVKAFKVPIQFSSKEKSIILEQYTDQQLKTRNASVLPRMSLVFESLEPALNRAKNKFVKINKQIQNEKIEYQFNSVPYDFNYRLVAQTRGMSEATMIIEQICSYFNPSYCLKIKELPFSNYTSIIVDLNSTDIDQQEYDEYSFNLVTITFNLKLRGNIYPSIKETGKVKQLELFINEVQKDDEYQRLVLLRKDIFNKKTYIDEFVEQRVPKIKDIIQQGNKLEVIFEDLDNKLEFNEFIYNWNYNGVNKGTTNSKVVELTKNKGLTEVSVQIIDYHGNQSNLFTKSILI